MCGMLRAARPKFLSTSGPAMMSALSQPSLPNAGLNVYDILRAEKLVLTKAAVDAVHARFSGEAKSEKEAA